jgi:MoaA/NifB/PqqE/SkfB family radical SAM enzyme
MKTRIFEDKNYKAIYSNGKTMRIALDPTNPILELDYPEFYDVKITDYCTGNCPWCYMDSKECGKHFRNILNKTQKYFGGLTENQRPFQVAIGGGNPNQHPKFIQLLKLFHRLGITPNYTTNGIGLTTEILKATKKYCGGVAVSCHEHLVFEWSYANAQ